MLISTPADPTDFLWKERADPAALVERVGPDAGPVRLPVLGIGRPEVWPLRELLPLDNMPAIAPKLIDADFVLARFSCSFRPEEEDLQLKRARFLVKLAPGADGRQATAWDMFPANVTSEIKRNVKLGFSAELKLDVLESAVEKSSTIEYSEVQPIVTAAGLGQSSPSWTFQDTPTSPLVGSRWLYLIMRVPKAYGAIVAEVELVVWVRRSNGDLISWISNKQKTLQEKSVVPLLQG